MRFISLLTALCFSLITPAIADSTTKPVIGISGVNANSQSVRAMITQVAASGGTPLFLSNFAERDAATDITKIDGLIVMGNSYDIDPARYGDPEHPETANEKDSPEGRARADYEFAIMEKAVEMKMPLLGICGGHQRINVLRGGTLHQHVPDLVGHEKHAQFKQNIAPFVPVMPVSIKADTLLASIADDIHSVYTPTHGASTVVMENSMHHQAINKVGDGLHASAFSDEYREGDITRNIIEAVEPDPNGELKDQFILGVQWHPEFSASPLAPRITARLVKAASTYATENKRTHPTEEAAYETRLSALPSTKQETAPELPPQ